jgi:hypothetical protein
LKFYKYWAPAEAPVRNSSKTWPLRVYGDSNDSLEDAKRRAREIAEQSAVAIERNQPLDAYSYDRPLREEIVEEIRNGDERSAIITRNAYGSLVLNTGRVMFVDVDYPASPDLVDLRNALKRLWSRLTGGGFAVRGRDDRLLDRFEQVAREQNGLGMRVYRTSGGYRLLVTSELYDPVSASTRQLLTAFGSDPLYIRLCQAQECFRARLSAKHWRCGAPRPPLRYPWADAAEEARYRQWEQEYHRHANRCATCTFVGSFGSQTMHASVVPIVETHDRLTIRNGAPLA